MMTAAGPAFEPASPKRRTMPPEPEYPALYVHVPFCGGRCAYCDFYSVAEPGLAPAWLAALAVEIGHYRGLVPGFASLYLGGGTPSLLAPGEATRLMELLREAFVFLPDAEITLEVNPEDAVPEKLACWRGLGVNRLSLGVQSLHDPDLGFLGRRHTARRAREALAACRRAGFANLGVDLIYALPGQTEAAWARTLEEILGHAPEHLSCYQLTVEPGTPLAARQARGEFRPAGEAAEAELFRFTSRFLEDRGYLHYEISSFARGEGLTCRHNQAYWRHVPYLGLGPSAHSFAWTPAAPEDFLRGASSPPLSWTRPASPLGDPAWRGRRWWNHRSLADYVREAGRGPPPVAGGETLSVEQLRLEALMLGLRTRLGVPLSLIPPQSPEKSPLADLIAAGWLTLQGDRVIPTLKGWLLADRLPGWLCPENEGDDLPGF